MIIVMASLLSSHFIEFPSDIRITFLLSERDGDTCALSLQTYEQDHQMVERATPEYSTQIINIVETETVHSPHNL